jgi:UDP-2,3-diacylglucosamine hydrolase
VSDAHLGQVPESVSDSFHRFLEAVPDIGDHLLINGDLFDFWFEYRSVIPRAYFNTLVAISRLRERGVHVTLTGGNHDRWGSSFWNTELGAEFVRGSIRTELAGWKAWIVHGDGLAELDRSGSITHAVCSHPVTAGLFRLLHPDLGIALARRFSRFTCARRDRPETVARAAEAQARYARKLLAERPDLDLVVMGHTHKAALESVAPRRWYLNPGAWMDGCKYAVIKREGPELAAFG